MVNPLEVAESTINGITALIYVLISIIIGLILIFKFLKYRDKVLPFIGLNIILLPCSWWPAAFGYLLALGGIYLENIPYSIILQLPQTINIFLWVYIFSDIHFKDKKKKIIIIMAIYAIIWETLHILFTIIDVGTLVIDRQGLIDIKYQLPLIIMVPMHLLIFACTFLYFSLNTLKSPDPEIKFKGIFLLYFIIAFLIGAILDSFLPGDIIALIARIILISASFSLYIVFAMPEWLKKRIKK